MACRYAALSWLSAPLPALPVRAAFVQVSPLMDRESTNIPSAQIGFVKVLVAPLFNAWAEANITLGWSDETDDASEDDAAAIMYSRADGEQCVRAGLQVLHEIDENLTDNLATWEKIKSGTVHLSAGAVVCGLADGVWCVVCGACR